MPESTEPRKSSVDRVVTPTAAILAGMKAAMTPEDLAVWRIAPIDRPSADERRLPEEYPIGWYGAEYTDDLKVGQVKPLRYFGTELVLWRGEDGRARILDAYCPHQGAHLGHGGTIEGNEVVCPYHAWHFDETGAVTKIPYARSVPPRAGAAGCVRRWHTREQSGFVWIWYHPKAAPPLWEPLEFEEIGHPDYTPLVKHEWNIYTSLLAFTDNVVDVAHLRFLHGTHDVPAAEIVYDGVSRSTVAKAAFDTPRGAVNGTIESASRGPAQGITRFTGISQTVLLANLIPVDRDFLKVRYAFCQPKSEADGPRANLARALIANICMQTDQDKIVLDHVRGTERPMLCDGDENFAPNRRWMAQFFLDGAS